jgi:hypothetical protein
LIEPDGRARLETPCGLAARDIGRAYLHAERGFAVGTMSHDDRRNGTVTLFV